jgi:hypothetical protein
VRATASANSDCIAASVASVDSRSASFELLLPREARHVREREREREGEREGERGRKRRRDE